MSKLASLLNDIRACTICNAHLPQGANPVLRAQREARLLLIGQAPGIRVHNSGVPWDDPSGDRLREWLRMDKETFYGPKVAIVPMGFCYPGKGKSGDLPPRPECADTWHANLLAQLPQIELTLLIGSYAQRHYLANPARTLTETVKKFENYLPDHIPLPHPSPRNNIWLKKNDWFEARVLPTLRDRVASIAKT